MNYIWTVLLGLLVGVIYGLSSVRSPAPPIIALLGLLGILIGEQAACLVKRQLTEHGITLQWLREHASPHLLGQLPAQPNHRASLSEKNHD